MNTLSKKLLTLGASSVIAISAGYLVAPWEGGKKDSQGNNIAYLDMVGIPTICAGFTHGVKLGDKKTDEECDDLLLEELTKFNTQMKKNVRVPLSENEEIAYTSFVWNVGVGNWDSSTLLSKLNSGDKAGACKQILLWNKVTVPTAKQAKSYEQRGETCSVKKDGKYSCTAKGLTNRRQEEYKVCIGEHTDINKAIEEMKGVESSYIEETTLLRASTNDFSTEELPAPSEVILNASNPLKEADKASHECSFEVFGLCLWK